MTIFTIDDQTFSGVGVERLRRKFNISDGPASGKMLSGGYERDLIGTYYGYDMTLSVADLSANDYDALYEILSAPQDSHVVTMPYGAGTITFDAMIYRGTDDLIPMDDGTWWGNLTISFESKTPLRIPG